jgi:predicted phage terminase large subunit-like protein
MSVAIALPDQPEIDREAVRRRGFHEFVRRTWRQVEPVPFVDSWHIGAMCEHLTALAHRDGPMDLVINQPPGTSKSTVASILFPAWQWILDPGHRWICASFRDTLVLRDARKCRALIKSPWFQARWPHVQIVTDASAPDGAEQYFTTAGGMRFGVTVNSGVMGDHGDTHLVDDPIDPKGAAAISGVALDNVLTWHGQTMSTRFRNRSRAGRLLIMQRLHERDLAAHMIAQGAVVLCLPMEYEPNHPHRYARDPRREAGELLCPARYNASAVAAMKVDLLARGTASQLQQRPVPAGGLIFKEEYFARRWTELPAGGTFTLSTDAAFKDLTTSSWVVIQCWYNVGPNHFLVDQLRGHWGFNETCRQLRVMAARWPKALRKLIENKANGPAIIDALRGELPGIEAIEPEGGKEARAAATEPLWAAGNVWLPHPTLATYPANDDGTARPRGAAWVDSEFVPEHLSFPLGAADDQVDAASQYLNKCGRNPGERYKAAMKNAARAA